MTCSLDTVKRGSVDHIHLAWCCYGQVYISFQDMWTTLILLHRDGNNLTPMMPWAFTRMCIHIYTLITHIHYNTYTHTLQHIHTYINTHVHIYLTMHYYTHYYHRTHINSQIHTQLHTHTRTMRVAHPNTQKVARIMVLCRAF